MLCPHRRKDANAWWNLDSDGPEGGGTYPYTYDPNNPGVGAFTYPYMGDGTYTYDPNNPGVGAFTYDPYMGDGTCTYDPNNPGVGTFTYDPYTGDGYPYTYDANNPGDDYFTDFTVGGGDYGGRDGAGVRDVLLHGARRVLRPGAGGRGLG